MPNDFTHLHIHGMGSLLDGLPFPHEIVERAKELGHESIALTDHGTLSASLQFYLAAKEAGIKPIIGMEGYLAEDLTSREKDDAIYHIGLLAQNYGGYKNLCRLSDIAWNKGFYKKPRIDFNTLKEHSEGLIVLSGCMDGVISRALREERHGDAMKWMQDFYEVFGERFFVEVQPWNPPGLNEDLMLLSDTVGVRVVATADAHYCKQEDSLAEEVSLLINQGAEMRKKEKEEVYELFKASRRDYNSPMARINFLYPDRKLRFDKINNYVMSKKNLELRMLEAKVYDTSIYSNTLLVSDMVEDYEIPMTQDYLPKYLKSVDGSHYLRSLAMDALEEKKLDQKPGYKERLEEELHVIETLNFSNYMLIIWDMCHWAHSQGITVGPGRGSVGGSLLAYVLGITRIDPIQHGLLFWRFLNMDETGHTARTDPPDIDTDFEDRRRDEVKEYLVDRWKNVASISAVNKFSSKGMVRDLSRVFAIPLAEVNEVCKHFNDLEEFFESEKTLKFRTAYPEIGELAKKFEGRWRFSGVHAAGMVVANRPLEDILPLESRNAGAKAERIRVTSYDMDDVQQLGLIKFDVLGVAALSVLSDSLKLIKARHGIDLDIDSIPLDDKRVLSEFGAGHTAGIFQVDTQSYTSLLKTMGVDSFTDLMASNALVRPGPLLTVTPAYINRKHGREKIPKEHPLMWEITSDTYGLIIYQEQLMKALVSIGGFSRFQADKVRKIIGKKRDAKEFKPFEEQWLENASPIVGKTRAKKLWSDFLKFAGYAFNKSHACAYSFLSYQTMYLKVHFPLEFMCALLKNEDKMSKVTTFIFEAKRLGIEIALPDINTSEESFRITDDGKIQYGLNNIHGVGKIAAQEIISKRPYTSYEDFSKRIARRSCNSKVINSLINVGAFRDIKDNDEGIVYEDYYYSLLGYAQSLSEDLFHAPGVEITHLDELVQEEIAFINCLVKAVESKPAYKKIEVEDASGASTFFCSGDYEIEAGRIVVAAVFNKDWIGHSNVNDFNQNIKENTTTRFENYVLGQVFGEEIKLYNEGVGTLEDDKCLVMPIHVRTFKVRKEGPSKGKSMASFIATDSYSTQKFIVFPKSYANCAEWLKPFEPIVIKKMTTKDGTYTVAEDGVRLAHRLMKEKGLSE